MQVNDATVAPVLRKDDSSVGGADAAQKGARHGGRFRDALRRAAPGGAAEPESQTAQAAMLAGWFRAEPGPRSPPPPPPLAPAASPSPPCKIDRILIGEVGGDVQARIRIGSGALAGAEIRLSSAPGSRAVVAELLTRTIGSRQTLSVAMEELRLRLRNKGIALAAPVSRRRGGEGPSTRRPGDGDGDGDGDGAKSRGGTGR